MPPGITLNNNYFFTCFFHISSWYVCSNVAFLPSFLFAFSFSFTGLFRIQMPLLLFGCGMVLLWYNSFLWTMPQRREAHFPIREQRRNASMPGRTLPQTPRRRVSVRRCTSTNGGWILSRLWTLPQQEGLLIDFIIERNSWWYSIAIGSAYLNT